VGERHAPRASASVPAFPCAVAADRPGGGSAWDPARPRRRVVDNASPADPPRCDLRSEPELERSRSARRSAHALRAQRTGRASSEPRRAGGPPQCGWVAPAGSCDLELPRSRADGRRRRLPGAVFTRDGATRVLRVLYDVYEPSPRGHSFASTPRYSQRQVAYERKMQLGFFTRFEALAASDDGCVGIGHGFKADAGSPGCSGFPSHGRLTSAVSPLAA